MGSQAWEEGQVAALGLPGSSSLTPSFLCLVLFCKAGVHICISDALCKPPADGNAALEHLGFEIPHLHWADRELLSIF